MESRSDIIIRVARECAEEILMQGLDPHGDLGDLPWPADLEAARVALEQAGYPTENPEPPEISDEWRYGMSHEEEDAFVRAYLERVKAERPDADRCLSVARLCEAIPAEHDTEWPETAADRETAHPAVLEAIAATEGMEPWDFTSWSDAAALWRHRAEGR
jgi:hypothetical protein